MSNIIKATASKPTLSEGKGRQLYRDSMAMIHRGITRSTEDKMGVAAGIWNMREYKLPELEGYATLEDWAKAALGVGEEDGMGRSTFFSLLQFGDRIREYSTKLGGGTTLNITQKDVSLVFEASAANTKDITTRGLFKSLKNATTFEKYLATGSVEEVKTEAAKLLKPRKLTDAELEELEEKERKSAATSDRLNTWGHAYAISHGIHMNRESGKWEHEDGTPLSKRELGDLTSFSDGLQPWERALESIAHVSADIYKTLHTQGELFVLYSQKENKKFEDLVDNHRTTIQRRLDSIELMITRFREGDVAGAEKAYKEITS
jgi:hypothetical protein